MNWLIITSARQGLSATQLKQDKQAGNVFIYQLTGVKGLIEDQYQQVVSN